MESQPAVSGPLCCLGGDSGVTTPVSFPTAERGLYGALMGGA